jgi:hypothetical protein
MNQGVAPPRDVCGRDIVHRDISERPTLVVKFECAEFCLAKPNRILQHRLEYRLKLARRATDDAQHLRCGFLSLKRLVALTDQLSHVGLCFVICRGWIA